MSTDWIDNWESFGVWDESAKEEPRGQDNVLPEGGCRTANDCKRASTSFPRPYSTLPPPDFRVGTIHANESLPSREAPHHADRPASSSRLSLPSASRVLYEALESTQEGLSQCSDCRHRAGGGSASVMSTDERLVDGVCPLYYYALLLNASPEYGERLFRQYSRFVMRFEQLLEVHREERQMLLAHQQQDLASLTDIIGVATSVDGVLTAPTLQRHQKEMTALRWEHQRAEKTLERQLQRYWFEYAFGLAKEVLDGLPLQNFQTLWRWGEYLLKPPQDTLGGLPDHASGIGQNAAAAAATATSPGAAALPLSSLSTSLSASQIPFLSYSPCGLLAYVIPYYGVPAAAFALHHSSPESSNSYLHARYPVMFNVSSTDDLALCLGRRPSCSAALSGGGGGAPSTHSSDSAVAAAREELDETIAAVVMGGRHRGDREANLPSSVSVSRASASPVPAASSPLSIEMVSHMMWRLRQRHLQATMPHHTNGGGAGNTTKSGEVSVAAARVDGMLASEHESNVVFRERVIAQHLEGLCLEAYSVLLLIGTESRANALLDSVLTPELLLSSHSYHDRWATLVDEDEDDDKEEEEEREGEGMHEGEGDESAWAGLGDDEEGVPPGRPHQRRGWLRVRTSSRFWGAQVVLLYTPVPAVPHSTHPRRHESSLDHELGHVLRRVLDMSERWGMSTISIALLAGPLPIPLPHRTPTTTTTTTTNSSAQETTNLTSAVSSPSARTPPAPHAHPHSWGPHISETQALLISLLRQLRQCLDDKRDVHHRPLYASRAFAPECYSPSSLCPSSHGPSLVSSRTTSTGAGRQSTAARPGAPTHNTTNNRTGVSTSTVTPHERPYIHLFLPISTTERVETGEVENVPSDNQSVSSVVLPKKRWTGVAGGGGFLQTIIGNAKPTPLSGMGVPLGGGAAAGIPPAIAAAAAAQLSKARAVASTRRSAAQKSERTAAFRYAQLTFPESSNFQNFLKELFGTPVTLT